MPETKNQNFNHLKIHTQYSICEGAIKIEDLKNFCKENKIQSVGLSDTSNLCGALEFAENISKVGTQPIIGTQINFKFEDTVGLIPLIALNNIGYKKNIQEIIWKDFANQNKIEFLNLFPAFEKKCKNDGKNCNINSFRVLNDIIFKKNRCYPKY